jgi:NAD(P)-dependent dehydrogenase (short-subunit alcohol dehydrogenase family)
MLNNLSYGRPLALITGAYGGMGLACVRQLGRNHDLVLTDYDRARLDATAQTLIEEGYMIASAVAGDMVDPDTLGALSAAVSKAGTLHAFIHTAALSPSLAGWRDIMRVNVVGTDRLLKTMEPLLGKGSVTVLIASESAHLAPGFGAETLAVLANPQAPDFLDRIETHIPGSSAAPDRMGGFAYMLSKWWKLRLCEALAASWGARGARIATISPGMIWTPMGRKEAGQPHVGAKVASAPLPRWGTPMDIADAVEFLVSDRASFITGCDIRVDGGSIGKFRATGKP